MQISDVQDILYMTPVKQSLDHKGKSSQVEKHWSKVSKLASSTSESRTQALCLAIPTFKRFEISLFTTTSNASEMPVY